ncbi:MAG: hypothetical protein EYC69_08225 [Bacteroidetes bacterium]|nr:MAG: hypothetical protein EYC69_08225 [Bacteroidota bacterium]
MKKFILLSLIILSGYAGQAQFLNREDSMIAGLNPGSSNVILSGYGEAKYSYNSNLETASINLTRAVVFVGYRFNNKISLLTEIEIEDAKVDGDGGELAFEQCLLKFDLNKNNYLLAGLFIPRIGIINENHLPNTFNGNDRHVVERMVIPSTWRELGIGYYGNTNKIPGLNWSLALMNGLNAEGITGGRGLRDARFEGRDASASNLALSAALLYYNSGLRIQASTYYGGTVGLTPRAADSLGLDSGPFGTPVSLNEINAQYSKKGFTLKALAAVCAIPDADKLNVAFASNAPESMFGYMAELGYNVLETSKWKEKQLILFARYESMDLMNKVPSNGIKDELYKQEYIIAGLTYLPIRNVAIKLDWKHVKTGDPNPALIFAPNPNEPAYEPVNNFYQLGFAYSF